MQKIINPITPETQNLFTNEKDLYKIWINFSEKNNVEKHCKLKGINPGELNEREGPDFQGAEFELNGKIYRGDVEIHKNCSDWKNHAHHLDQRYDRVVLHLVASKNLFPVYNSKNQKIPSLSLLNFEKQPNNAQVGQCPRSCRQSGNQNTIEHAKLQELALMRMEYKSIQINENIASLGTDQALYSLILKSLGNVENKNNYQRLSQLIPWKLVYLLKVKNNPLQFWEALYLGAAGFLDEFSPSGLLSYWKNCQNLPEGIPIKKETWRKGGIRPNNLPKNRLLGLAMFIWRLQQSSLYNTLEELFYCRLSPKKIIESLSGFLSNKNGYKKYWGKNLVLEMTGNVFVPFFYKMAVQNNSYGFQLYLKQLFLELPATQSYGKLKNLRSVFPNDQTLSKYFYFNQALLYLHYNYCTSNNFNSCPLKTIQQKN